MLSNQVMRHIIVESMYFVFSHQPIWVLTSQFRHRTIYMTQMRQKQGNTHQSITSVMCQGKSHRHCLPRRLQHWFFSSAQQRELHQQHLQHSFHQLVVTSARALVEDKFDTVFPGLYARHNRHKPLGYILPQTMSPFRP